MRKNRSYEVADLGWLSEVRESRQPLSERTPIWVRHGVVTAGPTIPHPERHPYCELSTVTEGSVVGFVGREKANRLPGDYFLAGPGLAHWFQALSYPVKYAAIYFLPSVAIDMGPNSDGMRILRRFTAKQTFAERLVRPPGKLADFFRKSFEASIEEFDQKRFGHEIRLRTLLMEMLVQLLRWEEEAGRIPVDVEATGSWIYVERVLNYIRDHYTQEIYARDLAKVAAVSESRLKALFQSVLGMPWSRYLQSYRIHRAAALLSEPGHNVLEAALAVGFESLSHFNATFSSIMGVSPSVYAKKAAGKQAKTLLER